MVKKQNMNPGAIVTRKTKRKSSTGKKKKMRMPAQAQTSPGIVLNIPQSTQLYGNSLCSPDKFQGAGVPSWPALPTLKTNAFIRGILSVGSAGYGFVYCAPEQLGLSNGPGLRHSISGFAGSDFSPFIAGQTVNVTSNAQFDSSTFGNGSEQNRWRLVSACLRARYIGTELNRGGSIIAFAHPEHLSLTGMTATDVLAFNTARKTPINREWTTVLYCPITIFGWKTALTAENGADNGDFFMGLLIESGVANNQFEFEFFGNYEYEGPTIRGKTRCINDSVGMASIQAGMQSSAPVHVGNDDKGFRAGMWERFKEYALKTVTWVGRELRDISVKAVPIVAEASLAALAAL